MRMLSSAHHVARRRRLRRGWTDGLCGRAFVALSPFPVRAGYSWEVRPGPRQRPQASADLSRRRRALVSVLVSVGDRKRSKSVERGRNVAVREIQQPRGNPRQSCFSSSSWVRLRICRWGVRITPGALVLILAVQGFEPHPAPRRTMLPVVHGSNTEAVGRESRPAQGSAGRLISGWDCGWNATGANHRRHTVESG
jgi:hypothetical protein